MQKTTDLLKLTKKYLKRTFGYSAILIVPVKFVPFWKAALNQGIGNSFFKTDAPTFQSSQPR